MANPKAKSKFSDYENNKAMVDVQAARIEMLCVKMSVPALIAVNERLYALLANRLNEQIVAKGRKAGAK